MPRIQDPALSRRSLTKAEELFSGTPPDFFPRRGERNFESFIVSFLWKVYCTQISVVRHPPNFTPSAEKRFFGFHDNLVRLGAMIATSSLTI
jgi:hypothetical protein